MTIYSCSDKWTADWQQEYIKQEKKRIVTLTKYFDYESGDFSLSFVDTAFETYNEKGQLLSLNNKVFYNYDEAGKLIAEEYCGRSCEYSQKKMYYYDSLSRLIKNVIIDSKEKEYISAQYYYNDRNLLVKKIFGNDSNSRIETYTSDISSRMTTKTKKQYDTNTKEWLTFIDTMIYGTDINKIIQIGRRLPEDLLTISKYTYRDTLLITQVDSAITTNKNFLPKPETLFHANFFRTDYKYNKDSKVIEKITTRPDYKTPYYKITYEYR